MKRRLPGIAACALCMVLLGAAGTAAQESTGDARNEKMRLEKEIKALDEKIRVTDSLILREQELSSLLKKRLADGLTQKKSSIAALQDKLIALDKEAAERSSDIAARQSDRRAVESRRAFITTQLIGHCRTLDKQIGYSLPWNREQRTARVRALRMDLESGAATVEDGFSRLMALIEEEIAFGDETVLDTRTIGRNDGTQVNARVLRVGNQWMAYVDASEVLYGILSRENDSTSTWKETLDFAQREQIRTAIRVKESKKAPQIITLPVTLPNSNREAK